MNSEYYYKTSNTMFVFNIIHPDVCSTMHAGRIFIYKRKIDMEINQVNAKP